MTTAKPLQLFPVEHVPCPWWDTEQQGAAGLCATQGQKNLTAWSDFQDCPESGIKELLSHHDSVKVMIVPVAGTKRCNLHSFLNQATVFELRTFSSISHL